MKNNKIKKILITAALLLVLLAASFWAFPRVQIKKADSLLMDANGHIERTNRLFSEIETGRLGSQSFASLDDIEKTKTAIGGAETKLAEAEIEAGEASEDINKASRLTCLPAWYDDYLEKKVRLAELRRQQTTALREIAAKLEALYEVAPVIFEALAGFEKQMGRLESGIEQIQSNPEAASSRLKEVILELDSIKQSLDGRYAETSFQLLDDLSGNIGENTELARQALSLAEAAASGDQSQVQKTANTLYENLQKTEIGLDRLDIWMSKEIKPLEREYERLQEEEEVLDGEAEEIYQRRFD